MRLLQSPALPLGYPAITSCQVKFVCASRQAQSPNLSCSFQNRNFVCAQNRTFPSRLFPMDLSFSLGTGIESTILETKSPGTARLCQGWIDFSIPVAGLLRLHSCRAVSFPAKPAILPYSPVSTRPAAHYSGFDRTDLSGFDRTTTAQSPNRARWSQSRGQSGRFAATRLEARSQICW